MAQNQMLSKCVPCVKQEIECVCPLTCKFDHRCLKNSHTCFLCPRGKEIKFPEGQLKEHIAIEHIDFKNKICSWGARCKHIKYDTVLVPKSRGPYRANNRCTRIHICAICTKSANFDNQFENGIDLKRHLFERHTFQSVFIQITQIWDGIPLEFWKIVFNDVMHTNRLIFQKYNDYFKCFYSKDYFSSIWTFVNQDRINSHFNFCNGSCVCKNSFTCKLRHRCLYCGLIFRNYDNLYEHIKNRHSIELFSEKFPDIISEDSNYHYNSFKMMEDLIKERYSLSDISSVHQQIRFLSKNIR